MNLRISENQLRFRITCDELTRLMSGEILQLALHLGTLQTAYCIALHEGTMPLALTIHNNIWQLTVDKVTLSEFSASLPARNGIEHEVQLGMSRVILLLEVDVRRKR